jgi:hypothetical protein
MAGAADGDELDRVPQRFCGTVESGARKYFQAVSSQLLLFGKADYLKRLMPLLVRHGMLSFSSADVMRYFGRKVNLSGQIPARFSGTLKKIFSGDRCAKG